MDDSTPQDHHEYLGDADGAAGDGPLFGDENDDLNLREEGCLEELVRAALAEAEAALPVWRLAEGAWRRQAHALDDSMPGEAAVPVRLPNGSTAWLDLSGRAPEVYAEPLRSDRIILAALCAAGTIPIDLTGRGNTKKLWRAARAYVLLDRAGLMEPFDLGRILEAAGNDPRLMSIKGPELFDAWKLRLHDALIRRYRPDYAELGELEQITELVEVAARMDAVHTGLRDLQSVLEEGSVKWLSKQRPRGDHYKGAIPQRDVLAAALRDALGLTHRGIAVFLEFPLPADFRNTGKIPAVANAIKRGKKLLIQALADVGAYERYMKQIRPELKEWYDYRSSMMAQEHAFRQRAESQM